MDMSSINWLAAIVAAVSAFALGGLWYSPMLFAKPWMQASGVTEEKAKTANMPMVFGIAFIWALRAAPLFARGWFRPIHVRLVVVIIGLALINAYSWEGQLWVIWPAGIMLLFILLGMLRARPH